MNGELGEAVKGGGGESLKLLFYVSKLACWFHNQRLHPTCGLLRSRVLLAGVSDSRLYVTHLNLS